MTIFFNFFQVCGINTVSLFIKLAAYLKLVENINPKTVII